MSRRLLFLLIVAAGSGFAEPARIVSTSPTITETLFALGLGNHVVGVTTYCRYPPAVLSLPKIGTYFKPDPEKIALLTPDLVIIHRQAVELAGRLSAMHIRYAVVDVASLADIYSMTAEIGRAADVPERAAKLNNQIRSRLDNLRVEAGKHSRPRVLIILGRDPGQLTDLIAVGPGTYLGEMLPIAGGINVLTSTLIEYPHISLETVVRLNPDVILDSSFMGEAGNDPASQEERLRLPWLNHNELSAVRSGRIFGITAESLVTPGPRVADAVELIRTKIHLKETR